MLVINGFFENCVFIPEKPPGNIKGKQKVVLHIGLDDEKQERLNAWKDFSQAIKSSYELLEGEPERIRYQ